jgi:hypothetical protein
MNILKKMILCSLKVVRFCSPFVHYQTTEPNVPSGALHGGTHIDTMVYQVPLVDSLKFSVQVPVQVLEPGDFSIVVGAFFVYPSTANTNTSTFYAVQVANVASDFPIISFWQVQVSRPAQLAAYVLIACSGSVLLVLLLTFTRHRHAQVYKLTQGNTLIAMMVAALIATVSSLTYEPKSSLSCNLQGPLIILPLHVLYAILLGRLWRIQAVVSPLLLLTLERKDTWSDKFVQWLRKVTELKRRPLTTSHDNHDRRHDISISVMDSIRASWIQTILKRNSTNIPSQQPLPSTRRSFRRKVTEGQLARVVAIFCIPQVIVQVLYLIFARERLMNGACPSNFFGSPTDGFGGVLLLLLVFLLLAMARSSKDLPSLFNENEALWDVSLVSLVLLGVAFVVIVITHAPTTNPDIRYIVSTLVVVAVTTNTCTKIVLPKLRKIWQNEKVVVTKLISDHNRQERSPLVIIPESPDDEREEEEEEEDEENRKRKSRRRNDSIAPPISSRNFRNYIPSRKLPQNRNHVVNGLEENPDQDGTDSDESSVMLIEAELGEPSSLYRFQSEGGESNAMIDTQSLESQHPDDQVVDSIPYRFEPPEPAGKPRSSLLSASSNTIPENATLPVFLDSQFPSLTSGVPVSEPSPPSHRNVRTSRMRRRAPQLSIVRNRSRFSINRPNGSLFSQNSNGEPTQDGPANKGNTRLSFFGQKKQSTQLLDIGYNPKKRNQSIHISMDNTDPPPRRLLLRMIDVNHTLGLVNRAILSGDQVTEESWEFLREAVVALGRVFEEEVVFDWEHRSEELYTLNMPSLAATQSAPVAQGFPTTNSQQYPRQTTLAASQSAPFPRDSFYPHYISPQQHQRQPRTPSFTRSAGSAGSSDGGTASIGTSSNTRPSSNGEGRAPFPFSREHSGGGIFGGLLQRLPGSHSRLKQQASHELPLDKQHDLQPPSTSASPNLASKDGSMTRPRSVKFDSSIGPFVAGVIHDDVNEQKEEEHEEGKRETQEVTEQGEYEQEEEEDEEHDEEIQDELRKLPLYDRPRVFPISGRSSLRSQYRASHDPLSSSLKTIESLSCESMISEDSLTGFNSSRVFSASEQGSSSTLFQAMSMTQFDTINGTPNNFDTEQAQAIDSVLLPPSPVARVQTHASLVSDGSIKADDGVQETAESEPNGDGLDQGMDGGRTDV